MTSHMRFSIIPGWCATDPRLTGRDLQVLCVLGRHIDREGWCTRSQVKIAAELGCARGTVQNSLKRLGEIGVVEVRANETADGRDCAHDYRVLFDGPAPRGLDFGAGHDAGEAEKTVPPPANILAPPANPELAPPANPELAPYKNDPLRTTPEEPEGEREGAGARAGASARGEAAKPSDRGKGAASAHQASARGEAAQASVNEATGARGEAAQPSDHERADQADVPETGPAAEPETESRDGSAPEPQAGSDESRKALAQRVRALEFGPTGGKPWPGAKGSSSAWATARFAELTPDERERAETLRDAYLAACEAERVKPVALGVYFRDRKFEGLNPELAKRAAAAAGPPKPEAPPFGPVWAALRMRRLLAGPECETGTDDPFAASVATHAAMLSVSEATAASWRERNGLTLADGALAFPQGFAEAWRLRQQAAKGWPSVARMDSMAGDGAAMPCGESDLALRDLCEPVPIGSQVWREWEGEFSARGWPWLPKCGARPVVYFPKGGPDGLDEFKARLEG